MSISKKSYFRWLSNHTKPSGEELPMALATRVLRTMSRDPGVNAGSLQVANAFLATLGSRGVADEPIPSVDADGDVVLTWVYGELRGSALITESGISSVVSNGRKIAYLGDEVEVSERAIENHSYIALTGAVHGWQPSFESSSMMDKLFAGRFLSQECESHTLTSPAQHIPLSFNSSKTRQDDESNQLFGNKNLVMRHVTSSE